MEAASLCVRLSVLVFILLSVHNSRAVFQIIPNRLQLFQYETLSLHCEGLNGSSLIRGIRGSEGFLSACEDTNQAFTCTVPRAYQADGGEYWCETETGQTSNTVRVTVAPNCVILETPVLPVVEGDCVTLRCRNQTAVSNITTTFYKDGREIERNTAGEMTLHRVSDADQGLYKCNILDIGESPESWLAVRAFDGEARLLSRHSISVYLLLRTVLTGVMVILLLLLLGLLHRRNNNSPPHKYSQQRDLEAP
ncbi:high affinity immunoglobulin gamma Fc receptor I-like [Mugil cephalus]|uniref:high affinity immunoglobulin gamma Fc receptor I-like n=1 Tax=Mugil cephalus TaxID=48193 RepID=UPI001FB6E918|nr:high affinity immunoglobulin gamma Fc receptor I-like [Mugil cephalus]